LDLSNNTGEFKSRVYDFVNEWFKLHKPRIERSVWVDPRAKAEFIDGLTVNDKYQIFGNEWLRGLCTVGASDCKLKKYRWKYSGRLGRFTNYKLISRNGNYKIERTKQDFRKVNLRKYLKETECTKPDETKLPLAVNETCKVVGVYRGNYRRLTDKRNYGTNWIAYNAIKDYDEIGPEYTLKRVLPGAYEYNSLNLRQMSSPKIAEYSVKELIDGYFSRINVDFKLPKLNYYNINIIKGLPVNPKAFPGLLTSMIFGENRLKTTPYTKSIAIEYIKKIIYKVGNFYDFSLIALGGREKRVDLSKNKEIRTRIVMMMEDIPTLIGQSIVLPLTKAFQRLNDGFCWIGRSMEQQNYTILSEETHGDLVNTISFNGDFSNHDAHVSETQLIVAFGILRLIFPKHWRFMDKLFFYCASGLIYKHIVLPESRLIYRISKGIATGHPFTSLINTLCAYGTFAAAINNNCTQYEIDNYTRLNVGGDDVIGKLPINKVELINLDIQIRSGMVIDHLQEHCGIMVSDNPTLQNSFLKRVVQVDGVSWYLPELYENLITSPSGNNSSLEEVTRLTEIVMQGPNCLKTEKIFCRLIDKYFKRKIISKHHNLVRYMIDSLKFELSELIEMVKTGEFDKFIHNWYHGEHINHDGLARKYKQKIKNRINLAYRWFLTKQNFPGLGKKDDAYWLEHNKKVTVPIDIPNRHEFGMLSKRLLE
jgi:hypothetical protein